MFWLERFIYCSCLPYHQSKEFPRHTVFRNKVSSIQKNMNIFKCIVCKTFYCFGIWGHIKENSWKAQEFCLGPRKGRMKAWEVGVLVVNARWAGKADWCYCGLCPQQRRCWTVTWRLLGTPAPTCLRPLVLQFHSYHSFLALVAIALSLEIWGVWAMVQV